MWKKYLQKKKKQCDAYSHNSGEQTKHNKYRGEVAIFNYKMIPFDLENLWLKASLFTFKKLGQCSLYILMESV